MASATFVPAGAHSDILYHILPHLAADLPLPVPSGRSFRESVSASRALARLARAHSSFTRPALACLWRSLPNQSVLEHLLCTLGIAQKPPKKHQWHYPQMELFECDDSSWTRFREYSSLVRKIGINPFVGTVDIPTKLVHDTFWTKFLSSPAIGGTPILPRLEAVTLFSPSSFQHCSFDVGTLCLINPSIRELNIVLPIASAEHQGRLRRALAACFSSDLDLTVFTLQVPIPIIDIDALPRMHPRLCQLKLDHQLDIHPTQLTLLAALPNLERLTLTLNPWAPTSRPIAFPALRDLDVSSADLYAIGALLTHMDAPRLQSFTLCETHYDSGRRLAKDLPAHLRTLATKWPSLTAFEWHCNRPRAGTALEAALMGGGNGSGGAASEPLSVLLAPLLSLRALRRFEAHFYSFVVPYSPADFRALAGAWLALETFRVCDDHVRARHHTDLSVLLAFARGCPRLHTLHLPILKFDPAGDSDCASVAAVRQLDDERLESASGAHWLGELAVRYMNYSRRGEGEVNRTTGPAELLHDCMQKLFPSATLR